jgi:F420-0:gamma-glutamyl ligase
MCRRFEPSYARAEVLNSLRETQLEQGQVLTDQGQTMRAGFAGVNAGMEQIVALLDRSTGPDAD